VPPGLHVPPLAVRVIRRIADIAHDHLDSGVRTRLRGHCQVYNNSTDTMASFDRPPSLFLADLSRYDPDAGLQALRAQYFPPAPPSRWENIDLLEQQIGIDQKERELQDIEKQIALEQQAVQRFQAEIDRKRLEALPPVGQLGPIPLPETIQLGPIRVRNSAPDVDLEPPVHMDTIPEEKTMQLMYPPVPSFQNVNPLTFTAAEQQASLDMPVPELGPLPEPIRVRNSAPDVDFEPPVPIQESKYEPPAAAQEEFPVNDVPFEDEPLEDYTMVHARKQRRRNELEEEKYGPRELPSFEDEIIYREPELGAETIVQGADALAALELAAPPPRQPRQPVMT